MRIIRWISKESNKKWIYPIKKDIYKKGKIEKQIGEKLKIIGMSKVSIPSPMHPIIPYYVLLLEDENGNRMPKKVMKEYKIGDMYTEDPAVTDDAVSIVKIKYDIYEAIRNSIELLKEVSLGEESKILIKPSCIIAAYPYQAVCTNPEMIESLLLYLFSVGVKKENIIVAEQSLIGQDVSKNAAKAGIVKVCQKHEIKLMDISKGPFEEKEIDGFKFNIFKEAMDRLVINAPILKTNFQFGVSGAVENLSRLVDKETQLKIYENNFDLTIGKLVKAVPNVLNICDASNAMQGQGPLANGEPAFMNLIFSGKNPASVDTAFCEVGMFEVADHVKNTQEFKIKDLEVVGNSLEALKYPLKKPIETQTPHPTISVIDGKADPALLNMMNTLTSKLIGIRGDEINLVMGTHLTKEMLENKERLVALGSSTVKKLEELKIETTAKITEDIDPLEQIILLKKLVETKGKPKITPVDKVRSKMQKLLSKVVK